MWLHHALFFPNFSIPLLEPIGPQHYWCLIPKPPTWAFTVTSNEGTSLYALIITFCILFLTSSTDCFVFSALSMMPYAVSMGIGPFKRITYDSFNTVSTVASVVKNCSLTCNVSSCNFVIVFNKSYCLGPNSPTLETKPVLRCIVDLHAYVDSVTSVVLMRALFSSSSFTSWFNCSISRATLKFIYNSSIKLTYPLTFKPHHVYLLQGLWSFVDFFLPFPFLWLSIHIYLELKLLHLCLEL